MAQTQTLTAATDEQMATIRARRVDDVAREMMTSGVTLSWAQADDLGDEATDWISSRLGLRAETTDRGITYRPAEED
jgi:hypothetical protein